MKLDRLVGALLFSLILNACATTENSPQDPIKYGTPTVGTHPLLDLVADGQPPLSEDEFWHQVVTEGTPLITPVGDGQDQVRMVFLWRGNEDTRSVELLSVIRAKDRRDNLLEKIAGTNIWFKAIVIDRNTAVSYRFSENTSHLIGTKDYRPAVIASAAADPLNKHLRTFNTGNMRVASLAKGPDAPEPFWTIEKPEAPKGTVTEHNFTSEIFGLSRTISIYTPAKTNGTNLPIVFVSDGEKYVHDGRTPIALDNLLYQNKIAPVVGVFIHNTEPTTRGTELPCTHDFTNFLADEVLPWVRKTIPETRKTDDVAIAGSSYGGLAAACANLYRPEIFTHVLSQSGSYWWHPNENAPQWDGQEAGWVARQFRPRSCRGAKYYFDAGALEYGEDLENIGNSSEALADQLSAKGCDVSYQVFPGGHDLYFWQETIAYGLIELFGYARK